MSQDAAGFLNLLGQLTTVGQISRQQFEGVAQAHPNIAASDFLTGLPRCRVALYPLHQEARQLYSGD